MRLLMSHSNTPNPKRAVCPTLPPHPTTPPHYPTQPPHPPHPRTRCVRGEVVDICRGSTCQERGLFLDPTPIRVSGRNPGRCPVPFLSRTKLRGFWFWNLWGSWLELGSRTAKKGNLLSNRCRVSRNGQWPWVACNRWLAWLSKKYKNIGSACAFGVVAVLTTLNPKP